MINIIYRYQVSQPTPDLEKVGNSTKRKLIEDGELPSNLIYEETKKVVRHVPQRAFTNPSELQNDNPFEEDDSGGIYYQESPHHTIVKNTNIYKTGNEFEVVKEGTTRTSTVHRVSPL